MRQRPLKRLRLFHGAFVHTSTSLAVQNNRHSLRMDRLYDTVWLCREERELVVAWHDTPAFRPKPSAPVWRGDVTDIRNTCIRLALGYELR